MLVGCSCPADGGTIAVDPQQIEQAAKLLARSRLEGGRFDSLPEDCRPTDADEAYRIQSRLHDALAPDLGPLVAHKIGCTTPVMQAFLKIDHPCAGGIFASTFHQEDANLPHADFRRVGVECEIVAELAADLPPQDTPYSRDAVAQAVGAYRAGIEIVDDRYRNFRDLDVWTLAADDFFNAGGVLGNPINPIHDLEVAEITGRMAVNGREVGRGQGRDILGHPLDALAWLANLKSGQRQGLNAGAFVFLGSVVETYWPEPGDAIEVAFEGLSAARVAFS